MLLGLCMGSGALWSMLYGAGEINELKRCLVASFLLIGGAAVLLNIGVQVFLTPIMGLLRIPAEAWAGRQSREGADPLRGAYLDKLIRRAERAWEGLRRSTRPSDATRLAETEQALDGLRKMKEEWQSWQP